MTDRFTKGYSGERFRGICVGHLWGASPATGDVTLTAHFDRLDRITQIEMLSIFIDFLESERAMLVREQERDQ